MWSGPSQDPGGSTGSGPPNTQELNDLKDQFEQQQLLIAQLKEMLRKSEQTTVTQEKVEEYAHTLTKMKARAKRTARKEGSKESNVKRLETPASEKISLLRQQLEENRLKLAERGKSQKGIEDMVTQLKAQLDDSQILMNQTPLNLSLTEIKQETYSVNSSSQELYNILLNKERRISEMTSRIQKLEANVLDLQENLKEKDSVIDARTKAITLMSENLSKKGKSTLDALDDTKLQMRKMQENFVELESQMKEENNRLVNEIQQKEYEISNLKQKNVYLEETQNKLNVKISKLEDQIENTKVDVIDQSLDLSLEVEKLNLRIKELETLNTELEGFKDLSDSQKKTDIHEIDKLQKELQDRNEKIEELEKALAGEQCKITEYISTVSNLETQIEKYTEHKASQNTESTVNLDIKLENEEVTKLKKQLDESNKNMIKVKAQHKGKIKELNKKIESFKKINDSAAEVVKLQDENSKLNQTIAELEEEKGALQLKIMEADSIKDSTNVELTNELEKKLSEQATLINEKDNNIDHITKQLENSLSQIGELNENLLKLSHLENVQVKSEITSIELEEQMDKLELEKQELIKEKGSVLQENASLFEKLEALKKEKQEILAKLESYVQENIDLMDKLEKLSAEKVSSAESIEIVEALTQQEKLELEAYQKSSNIANDVKMSNEHLEENPELNESVNQLTEETSELLQKIELFTVERREVMEKMEQLAHENNQLNLKIKEIENNRDVLAETYEQLQNEKEQLDANLEHIKGENSTLEDKIEVLKNENEELKKSAEKNVSDSDEKSIENLQKDIEEYQSLIEIQRQELKELKLHLMGQDFIKTDKLELEAKVNSLQLQYENVLAENDSLVSKLKEQSEHVCQREDIEEELISARKRITEFEQKITENIQEIENYKVTIEENKNELMTSANLINELQGNISALKSEVTHYNTEVTHLSSVITDLNVAIDHLERENKENSSNVESVNVMSNQLEELKQALTQNIEQINEYQNELENNTVTIIELQNEIKTLNTKILETEHLLESKNDELKSIQKEKEDRDNTIQHLNKELKGKDENFHQTINDLKQKYLNLHQQLEANASSIDGIRQPLENKIQELEHKNREQLEKMKIIAANLKKKTQALQNLEQKYAEVNEKWETEQKEKETLKEITEKNVALEKEILILNEKLDLSQNNLTSQSGEYLKLNKELQDYKQRFISLENINAKLSEEISAYLVRYEDAQNTIDKLENKITEIESENVLLKADRENEFSVQIIEKEKIIKDLSGQLENLRYTSETSSNALKMKIQELEMFIETQDADLTKYKDRVNKLEEGLSFMEERRMSLERTAQELGTQLKLKTDEYEEVSQTEDILEKRLFALMTHDEIIENKLQVMTNENEEMHRRLKTVITENDKLNESIKQMKDLINSSQIDKETLSMMENEMPALRKAISTLEHDKKAMKSEYEHKLIISKEDSEKMEIELQNQLELFDKDRRTFAERNESLSDQIKEHLNQQEILSAEITDYKLKLEEQNKILLVSTEAYNKLQEEFQQVLLARNELKEINKLQDDTILKLHEQILNSNIEIEKTELLRKQLQEKSDELEKYQNESSQRQIENVTSQPNQFDFASTFYVDNDLQNLKQINEDLHVQISTLQREKENIGLALVEVQRQLEEAKTATFREEPQKSEELKSLKAQYNSLEMNYGKLTEENISLQNQIANLTEHLNKPKQSQEQFPAVFTWPGDEEISEKKVTTLEASSTSDNENTKEELLNKIKSLEFMLHDVEKQKNDALIHCNTLSEELTKLLYLNKNQNKSVEEENLNVNPKASQFEGVSLDIESQIMSADNTKITPSDLTQLHEYEYSPCKDIVDFQGPSTKPVVEEAIQPKSAYLCYDPDDIESNKPIGTFVENDDGWGWGPEEAKLEQEYLEKASSSPQSVQFKGQINILEEKIKVLEQARERHLEEIKQSQLKSGKLIKKLKEFKTKNEELASQINKKSDGFDDLNDAIQEELKSQIKNLEKKIKDINGEFEKEKQEKNNLMKRVDTLTASHEKMIENKEKQDVEIMSWQQRYRELNTKLEQFEWGEGSYDSPKHVKNVESSEATTHETNNAEQIKELTATIQELTLDNEELQAHLEEQRNLRIAAEKAKSVEPIAENMKTEAEYVSVLNERDSLQKHLSIATQEILQLRENLSHQLQNNDEIQRNVGSLNLKNQQLLEEIKNSDKSQFLNDALQQINNLNIEREKLINDQTTNIHIIEELRSKLEDLQKQSGELIENERIKYEERIAEMSNTLTSLNNQISALSLENQAVQTKLNDLEKDKENILVEIDQKNMEKRDLDNVIADLNMKLNNVEQHLLTIQNLNLEIVEVKELLKKKEEEMSGLKEKLSQQDAEYEIKLSETVQQLHDEWSAKVDQRGYDIAESWKMHLETRENEFLQIESVLKKEIHDLEEKYTTLVNENNELRKNVDTEIRNEVDRISALQQQINDRQQYINDLTKVVQDQKAEIENKKTEIANLTFSIAEFSKQLNTKNEEIKHFELIIQRKDSILEELISEKEAVYETQHNKIVETESELEHLKRVLYSKDSDLQDRENKITQYSQQIEKTNELCENLKTEMDEKVNAINDLSKKLHDSQLQEQTNKEKIQILNQEISESQQQVANYHAHMQQQYLQIETLNQEVLKHEMINEELSHKETELRKLASLLEEKDREHSISLDTKDQENITIIRQNTSEIDALKRRLVEMENQYEEIISTKDVDMHNLRIQLEEQAKKNEAFSVEKEDFMHVQTELALKTAECDEMKAKIEEQSLLIDEESKQLGELREIIQDQVLKIDDLQKELYEKSRHYDALIAEVDLTHKSEPNTKPEKHVKFSDEVEVRNTSTTSNQDDLSELVCRAELDLALYMLHQRDVRCEELTVELMQLLEERDTLQLKLSNALREKELLRSKYDISLEESPNKDLPTVEVPPVTPTFDTGSVQEARHELFKRSSVDPLHSKLSELKSISYRKDKTIVDEQELRRLQQLSIMQQHRDEAAKLPPEAAARLVDASYTLSRDVQSPSKVLLNWLWGRSTPKVNNI